MAKRIAKGRLGTTHLRSSSTACRQALDKLSEALEILGTGAGQSPKHMLLLDACIKRYEVLFEYSWKLLKIAVEYQGGEAPGPRPAIQEGIRYGWISDADFWALALDARNSSVHDYFGITHGEYVKIIRRFAKEMEKLLHRLSSLR